MHASIALVAPFRRPRSSPLLPNYPLFGIPGVLISGSRLTTQFPSLSHLVSIISQSFFIFTLVDPKNPSVATVNHHYPSVIFSLHPQMFSCCPYSDDISLRAVTCLNKTLNVKHIIFILLLYAVTVFYEKRNLRVSYFFLNLLYS